MTWTSIIHKVVTTGHRRKRNAYRLVSSGSSGDFSDVDQVVYRDGELERYAVKHMKEGSSIINSTSVLAYTGSPKWLDYSSTKGAIVSFTRGLALHLVDKGIRVNAVAPGPVWTPLQPASRDEEDTSMFGSNVPMGRAAQPFEIRPAYVFLASEDSSYFTGQVLHPNGGKIVNA
ncbi:glucose and ribitol dehydrogenase-like protein [Tanacetum coccineum]